MHENDVRTFGFQNGLQAHQHIAGNVKKSLPGFHNREIMIGLHIEHPQNLLEHLAMLAGHANDDLEFT